MKKIINPCKCKVYSRYGNTTQMANAFCEIEIKNNGCLYITGVIGPLKSGNCQGSAFQCADEIRKGMPTEKWTDKMLQEFCDIWDRWHLNDMNPCCEHQRQLGWMELAKKEVTLYHYQLKRDAISKQNEAENAALTALRNGKVFVPTEEQVMYAALPYFMTSHEELTGNMEKYYKPRKPLYSGNRGATEKKILGWLHPEEHPEGILSKACPVCGYKYGTAWLKEDLPQGVINFLESLPSTTIKPAWV